MSPYFEAAFFIYSQIVHSQVYFSHSLNLFQFYAIMVRLVSICFCFMPLFSDRDDQEFDRVLCHSPIYPPSSHRYSYTHDGKLDEIFLLFFYFSGINRIFIWISSHILFLLHFPCFKFYYCKGRKCLFFARIQ